MALCLGAVLFGGCRQEVGQCSGAANRLCIIYEQAGLAPDPDTLAVSAVSGSHTLAEHDLTSALQQALSQRDQYVFEIDLSMIAPSPSVKVTLSARLRGQTLWTQAQTWFSGQTPVLTFVFGQQRDMAASQQPDLSATHPDFSGTSPDFSGASPDLSGPPADLSPPPDASSPVWNSGSTAAATTAAGDLTLPTDVCWDGSKLYVSDAGNNRIVYYTPSISGGGQLQLGGLTPLAVGGTAPSNPTGLSCAPGSAFLFVADTGNNRVLVFNTTTLTTVAVAGQRNFTSTCQNAKGTPTCTVGTVGPQTLAAPKGVFLDAGNLLYIADTANYRVVGYQAANAGDIGSLSSASAVVVLGQPDLMTAAAPTGANAGTLKQPIGLAVAGGRIAVADDAYYRILVYPVPSGLPAGGTLLQADAVIGQTSLAGIATGDSATTLYSAFRLALLGGETAVADTYNNRVVIYEQGLPPAGTLGITGQAVLGQSGFGQMGAGIGKNQLNTPTGVVLGTLSASGTTLTFAAVADYQNNRVVIYVKGQS